MQVLARCCAASARGAAVTITIEEAKAAKNALRERIRQALREFTNDTGLTVERVELSPPHYWVDIEVQL